MGWKEDIVANTRKFWPDVVEVAGWKDRGNGTAWAHGTPMGCMNHHLVVPEDQDYEKRSLVPMVRDGHSGLSGPLANVAIAFDGTIYFIAGNPANHAGRGRRDVVTRTLEQQPPRGNAADVYGSGSDDYSGGNAIYWAAELQHRGTHPNYPLEQIRATYAFNAAWCLTFGRDPNCCIHHREYSFRKVDLSWRGDLRAGTRLMLSGDLKPPPPVEEDDLPYTPEQIKQMIREVLSEPKFMENVHHSVVAVLRAPEFNLGGVNVRTTATEATVKDIAGKIGAVVTPPPPVEPPPPPAPATHTVVKGDTLWSIARQYGVTIANLLDWNKMTGDVIEVGQVLRLGN